MTAKAIERLGFLLGEWHLDYHIPKSSLAEAGSDTGTGRFARALSDNYVIFDYSTGTGSAAHGIFAWDSKVGILGTGGSRTPGASRRQRASSWKTGRWP